METGTVLQAYLELGVTSEVVLVSWTGWWHDR